MTLAPHHERALEYATIAHAGQVRKGTQTPYIEHPIAVARLVLDDGGTEIEAIAALLHDLVEDQGGRRRLDDIERRFGARVAQIVAGCSEWIQEPHQTAADKPMWCERKRASIEHYGAERDASILRVALADKVHNAQTIVDDLRTHGTQILSRFNAGPMDQLWYYRGVVEAFRERGSPALHARLAATVGEMERLVGPVPERRPVVGVDGAPAGWVAVSLGHDCLAQVAAFADFQAVMAANRDAEIVAIDIPIGLDPKARREADVHAKRYLGRHASRVFKIPIHEALTAPTFTAALEVLRAAGLPGTSRQAYALRHKILEVDALAKPGDRVREVHPEVSFRSMNGGVDLRHGKKTPAGYVERRRLLQHNGIWLSERAFELKRVSADDVLDAAAAAWTALRVANGMAQSLPGQPRRADDGRPVAIWY